METAGRKQADFPDVILTREGLGTTEIFEQGLNESLREEY
jgi:hypothetical protein